MNNYIWYILLIQSRLSAKVKVIPFLPCSNGLYYVLTEQNKFFYINGIFFLH